MLPSDQFYVMRNWLCTECYPKICDEHVSSYCNFNIAVSLIFRYEKIKERNEPLVEFLKTNEVKVCILIQQRSTCMYKLLQMKSNEDCFVTSHTGTITE